MASDVEAATSISWYGIVLPVVPIAVHLYQPFPKSSILDEDKPEPKVPSTPFSISNQAEDAEAEPIALFANLTKLVVPFFTKQLKEYVVDVACVTCVFLTKAASPVDVAVILAAFKVPSGEIILFNKIVELTTAH